MSSNPLSQYSHIEKSICMQNFAITIKEKLVLSSKVARKIMMFITINITMHVCKSGIEAVVSSYIYIYIYLLKNCWIKWSSAPKIL